MFVIRFNYNNRVLRLSGDGHSIMAVYNQIRKTATDIHVYFDGVEMDPEKGLLEVVVNRN